MAMGRTSQNHSAASGCRVLGAELNAFDDPTSDPKTQIIRAVPSILVVVFGSVDTKELWGLVAYLGKKVWDLTFPTRSAGLWASSRLLRSLRHPSSRQRTLDERSPSTPLLRFPGSLNVSSLQQLFQFMNVAFALKDEIILTLPHKDLPTRLPPTLHLTDNEVLGAWTPFKHAVWSGAAPIRSDTSHAFQRLGRQTVVGEYSPVGG